MNKIQRTSLFFRVLFQITFLLLPLLTIITWVYAPAPLTLLGNKIIMNAFPQGYPIMQPFSMNTKLWGFTISLIPLMANLFVLYFLIKLFRLYEQGEIFTMNNVRYIRNTGYALLIGQLINPVYQALLSMALTWHNPPHRGLRVISVSLDGTNIGIVLMSLLIVLISWIMAEGYKLKEEQQLTV